MHKQHAEGSPLTVSNLTPEAVLREEASLRALAHNTWDEGVKVLHDVVNEHFGEAAPASNQARVERLMALYQTIYHAATQDNFVADQLHRKLRDWLDDRLADKVTQPLVALRDSVEKLSSTVIQLAKSFLEFTRFGTVGFMSVNNSMATRHVSIKTMFNQAFVNAVNNAKEDALGSAIRSQVHAHRDGCSVDLSALNAAIVIFIDVDDATPVGGKSVIEVYIKEAVMHPERGWAALLDRWDVSGLERMYELVVCLPPRLARTMLHPMGEALQRRLEAEASELKKEFNGDPLLTAAIELDDKYARLIQDHFAGNGIFEDSREKAFSLDNVVRYLE